MLWQRVFNIFWQMVFCKESFEGWDLGCESLKTRSSRRPDIYTSGGTRLDKCANAT